MKKIKSALWLAVLMIVITGCGNETEQLVESGEVVVEPIDNNDMDNTTELEDEQEEKDEEKDEEKNVSGENDFLEGAVKEINKEDKFVIINEIFTEKLETGEEVAVMVVDSNEEKFVTVYFTEETRFQIKTVKNAGEEVTEREGVFSDIRKESILNLEGKMDSKGEEFLATNVIIYEFIYT